MLGINDVKALLTQTDEQTLTLFVDVDNATRENQASVPGWKTWVKSQLDQQGQRMGRDQQASWSQIRAQAESFIGSYSPSARTLVLFANGSGVTHYELPIRIDENQLSFGRPQVGQLLWMIDEYEPYLLVLVDQMKARFFVTYLGSVGFQGGLDTDIEQYDFRERTTMSNPGPGADAGAVHGGSGVDDHEKMLAEHRARFYRETVEQIAQMQKQHITERIILGGSEQAAHAVKNLMGESLQKYLVGIVNIPMHETPQQIQERVQPLALEYERKHEFALVSDIIDFAKSGGRGALGQKAVETALEMQRVELLVMVWPSADEERDNELAFRALQMNSNIELVHGEAASLLHSEGDVAARLYYAL